MSSFSDPTQHIYWLASRSLGVVAIVLLAVSVTVGLALSGRIARQSGMPARLKRWHEAIALSALVAVAAHGFVLLGDAYLKPGLTGVIVPFAMDKQPAWTGIGILAGWLTAIFTLSFYVRRWITTPVWRWLHRFTLVAYVLAIVHTIGSGTDSGSWWMITTLIAITVPMIFVGTYRFLPRQRKGVMTDTCG